MIFCVIILLSGWAIPAFAQTVSPTTLRVIPKDVRAAVGEKFDVAVEAVDVADLYAIDILVAYDPQVVEVIDQDPVLEGIQVKLGTLLDPGFVIFNLADNGLGRLRMVMTQLNPSTPKSGTGALVVISFKAKAPRADSKVEVLAAQLASPAGQNIPVGSLEKANLEILTTLPGPTSTPIPAQNPGTPMPTPEPPTAAPGAQETALPILTFTPTMSLFNLPPAALVTQAPASTLAPASPTQTQAPAPTQPAPTLPATQAVAQAGGSPPAATPGAQLTGETAASASPPAAPPASPTANQAEAENQAVESSGINFTWPGLLIAVILVSGTVYLFLRTRKKK